MLRCTESFVMYKVKLVRLAGFFRRIDFVGAFGMPVNIEGDDAGFS